MSRDLQLFSHFPDISTSGFLNVDFHESSRIQVKNHRRSSRTISPTGFPLTTTDREAPFLWHRLDQIVAEAFLGAYLDRGILSQLQRLQPRFQRFNLCLLLF